MAYWLLHFHTDFEGPDHDLKFSRIVCNVLYNKNFFRFKMLSSSDGNDSEISGETVSELRENLVINKHMLAL